MAALKHVNRYLKLACLEVIHGERAVAALKPGRLRHRLEHGGGLHGERAVAALKRV